MKYLSFYIVLFVILFPSTTKGDMVISNTKLDEYECRSKIINCHTYDDCKPYRGDNKYTIVGGSGGSFGISEFLFCKKEDVGKLISRGGSESLLHTRGVEIPKASKNKKDDDPLLMYILSTLGSIIIFGFLFFKFLIKRKK